MDLLYFFKILYRRKWWIMGLSFIAALLTVIFLFFKKPFYLSIAQYSTGFTAEKVRMIDGTSAVDLFGADVKFNNVIETFKSPRVVSMISYRLLLHDLITPSKAYRKLSEKDMNTPIYKLVNRDSAILRLSGKLQRSELLRSDDEKERILIEFLKLYKYDYNNLMTQMSIDRVGSTDYLDIVYRSENPELSALVVNSMGDEFLNYFKNLNNQRTEENASSIRDIMDQQQKKVADLGNQLINEKRSQGTIDAESRSKSAMETVKELETKLAEEQSKYNEHKNRLDYLNERLRNLSGSSNSGGSNDDILRLTNRKNELVAELARKGGNDAALQQQINDLRSEILSKSSAGASRRKTGEDLDAVKNQISEETALLNASSSTIAYYNTGIRRYMGMTNSNPGSNVKMDVMKDQLSIENDQLKNIKEKYSQVEGLVKDDPTSNFIQTRIGQPAIEPESKKTLITTLLSGISMFMLASVIFLFIEIFDTAVKTPSVFSKASKAKMAATINHITLKNNSVPAIVLDESDGKKRKQDIVFKNNIRKLRHEMINSGRKLFLFTSLQRNAGKTTVLEAVAAGLLLSHKKVLVMDMNFNHNSLTKKFNAQKFIQDIEVNADGTIKENIASLVSPTEFEGLFILGCQETNKTPAEELYRFNVHAFFARLKEEYDIIIMEGAALNDFSDSKELINYAEMVYTVFSASTSISQPDHNSLQYISSLNEKNGGIVLNDILKENLNY